MGEDDCNLSLILAGKWKPSPSVTMGLCLGLHFSNTLLEIQFEKEKRIKNNAGKEILLNLLP